MKSGNLIVVAAAVLGASAAVRADHIPGHNNSDPIFPVPFPTQKHFDGGAAFVTLIGPVGGTVITHAVFDITYVSDGMTPASDLYISVEVPVNDAIVELELTGADLGFGSGAGTFIGTFETDVFNGLVWNNSFFPHSIIDMVLGAVDGGIQGSGYFVDSFLNLEVIPVPAPGAAVVLSLGLTARGRRRRR